MDHMDPKAGKRLDLGSLATFVPNKGLPVYNWFYFKEGFARDLVMLMLDRYLKNLNSSSASAKQGASVLDPFAGSGTTLVACKERGIDSCGFDVSPLAVLASRAKTNDYNADELRLAIKQMARSRFQRQDLASVPKDVRRFFNPHTLEDVLFFRGQLQQHDGGVNDFLRLGLITSATRCSYMYKDGAALKIFKKPVPVFRKFYIRTLNKMFYDLEKIRFKPCQTFVQECDARDMKMDPGLIDLVITSPPYLNKIEYTNVYGVEEFLFFGSRELENPLARGSWLEAPLARGRHFQGIRAYIGMDADADAKPLFPDQDLPPAANAYFADIDRVFSELQRVCRPGAVLCFVIGDGCFPSWAGRLDADGEGRHVSGRVVHADALLPQLAQRHGFETENIYTLNERTCTRNRVEKVGLMEESLIVMRKS